MKKKEIPGFEGRYFIFDTAVVKNVNGFELSNQLFHDGYYICNITFKRKKRAYRVHRLVAEAFVPNPDKLPRIIHLNKNKLDNRPANLKWTSVDDFYKYNSLKRRARRLIW